MESKTECPSELTRRTMLATMAAGFAGIASACGPARILLHAYPDEFDSRPGRVDRILRAFVSTVVPGVDPEDPNLVRAFYDDFYPLAPHRNFVAAELCSHSARLCYTPEFEVMEYRDRARVLRRVLATGGPVGRLFTGSVFLSQVSVYAGIYDARQGCRLIDFDGIYRMRPLSQTSYPDPRGFLARSTTATGNPG